MSIPTTPLKFPLEGKPVDKDGNWTPTWHRAMQGLFTRTGANVAPSNLQLATAISSSVVGSGGSVDGDVAVYSGTTGLLIHDTGIAAASLVAGPASSTDSDITLFNGASGKLVKDSGVQLSALATVSSLSAYAPLNSPALTGTPTVPTASNGTNTTQAASTAFVEAAVGGASNLIINGGFDVNQRGVSGTVTLAAGVYGHDRWKAGASGCTYTFATSGGVTTLTITAGSLQQVVEANNVRSGTYYMLWTGTAQGKIAGGSYSASGVSAVLAGGANVTVEFNTGTLSSVTVNQAGKGFIPIGFSAELQRCLRYCYRFSTDTNGATTNVFQSAAAWSSATAGFVQGRFPVRMVTQPTLVVEGGVSQFSIYTLSSGTFNACTALSLGTNSNADSYLLNFTTASGGTVGHTGYFSTNAQTTNSLRFEAEL